MTYPLSSDVSPGQPTASDHYNHLRADALRFGQDAADAVNLGQLFERYEYNLNLVLLGSNRLRVEASPTSPVYLIINGCPLRTTANIDLPSGSAPSGAAATWYIFAERSASSTAFTLNCNTSNTEYTDARRIGSFYWDGAAIVENSIITENRTYYADILKYAPPQAAQGRLCLASGVPVSSTDTTGGTLYYTPHLGRTVDLYAPGFGWVPYQFSELPLSLSALSANQNHDIFIYDTGSATLALEALAWSAHGAGASSRATALTLQDGRYVKNGSPERLYIGSIRTTTAGNSADTLQKRFVFNMYNRLPTVLSYNANSSHAYNAAAWRLWGSDANFTLEYIHGLIHDTQAHFDSKIFAGVSGTPGYIGIGKNITTSAWWSSPQPYSTHYVRTPVDFIFSRLPAGYNYLSGIQSGNAANPPTFYEANFFALPHM